MEEQTNTYSHRAKKSLGQNFLKSASVIASFVRHAGIVEKDVVVEIGPGKGAITKALLQTGAQVFAIEKDPALVTLLEEKFKEEIETGHLTIHLGDVLLFDPHELGIKKGYKALGSIPYYITSLVIRRFLETNPKPKTLSLIIQKEVAERIVARDGKESILSLSVKAFGNPTYVKTIKAKEFSPQPKVHSAILLIEDISDSFFNEVDEKIFFNAVREGFKQKRKKVISNLSDIYPKEDLNRAFEKLSLSDNLRAEDMTLSQWKDLLVTVGR